MRTVTSANSDSERSNSKNTRVELTCIAFGIRVAETRLRVKYHKSGKTLGFRAGTKSARHFYRSWTWTDLGLGTCPTVYYHSIMVPTVDGIFRRIKPPLLNYPISWTRVPINNTNDYCYWIISVLESGTGRAHDIPSYNISVLRTPTPSPEIYNTVGWVF